MAPRAVRADSSRVSMHADAGWNNRYRDGPSWMPVRLQLVNRGNDVVTGHVRIIDNGVGTAGQNFHLPPALYETKVVLPPGETKQVSVYLPGSDINGQITAQLLSGTRVISSASAFPTSYDHRDISVGVLTDNPSSVSPFKKVSIQGRRLSVVPLDVNTLDAIPEVLSAFDALVFTNVDSSRLDQEQLLALSTYVRDGGSLIQVGGPSWSSTLRPLPSTLLPGRISGSLSVTGLAGLTSLGRGAPPSLPTTVSRIANTTGVILAKQVHIPLVVRAPVGLGVVEYLAFDPSLSPFADWPGAAGLLKEALMDATPRAMRRLSLAPGYGSATFLQPPDGPIDVSRLIAGARSTAFGVLLILALLLATYVLLVGPLTLAVVHKAQRPGLMWLAVPSLALLFTPVTASVAGRRSAHPAQINSIGFVRLQADADRHPASLYIGLSGAATPHPVIYPTRAVGSAVLPFTTATHNGPSPSGSFGAWQFEEGARTAVTFLDSTGIGNRAALLHTSVNISGSIQAAMRLTSSGDVVGTIQNRTALRLYEPVVIAGRAVLRLPTMPAQALAHIHIRPSNDIRRHDYSPILYHVYGPVRLDSHSLGQVGDGPLNAQIQGAVRALPQSQILSMLGQLTFVAWTNQPLYGLSVAGSGAQQNSLSLLAQPLKVSLSHGSNRLAPGTIGPSMVEERPALPHYPCCNPSAQTVFIGAGGSATFEFDLPHSPGSVYRALNLSVYGGGADPSFTGYTGMAAGSAMVYDWRLLRWFPLVFHHGVTSLPKPQRYVSPSGAVLVKLRAQNDAHELTIADPQADVQLSGTAQGR